MEMTTHSLCAAKTSSLSPAYFPSKSTFMTPKINFNSLGYKYFLPRNLKCGVKKLRNNFGALKSASDQSSGSTDSTSVRWLLEPIGNGDCRHIGYKIAMPGAFEIASNVVTVGRVPEKADIVIPVPTVSGTHARIKKTEENLLIMDLDSTNGTFIDEKRLQPGVVSAAFPGNLVTFGDTNLAIFRVYKLEKEDYTTEEGEKDESSSTLESSS